MTYVPFPNIAITNQGDNVGRIAVVTTLGPCAGAISAVVVGRLVAYRESKELQRFSLSDACNGALGGLVAITAGCATVSLSLSRFLVCKYFFIYLL